ncbi:MAG: DUF2442 domain-containing protein [Verrucomicrobiota bacterium]
MNFVKSARYLENYKIFVEFTSGENGIVDLKDTVFRYAAAKEIRDQTKFREFYLDEWPTIAWKCGFDLSPETLYEFMTGLRPGWDLRKDFETATL